MLQLSVIPWPKICSVWNYYYHQIMDKHWYYILINNFYKWKCFIDLIFGLLGNEHFSQSLSQLHQQISVYQLDLRPRPWNPFRVSGIWTWIRMVNSDEKINKVIYSAHLWTSFSPSETDGITTQWVVPYLECVWKFSLQKSNRNQFETEKKRSPSKNVKASSYLNFSNKACQWIEVHHQLRFQFLRPPSEVCRKNERMENFGWFTMQHTPS